MRASRGLLTAASRALALERACAALVGGTGGGSVAAAAAVASRRLAAAPPSSLLPLSAAAAARGAAATPSAAPWLALGGVRGYARLGTKMPTSGYTPPAEMQRAMQMRLSMVSANLLAEPYRGIPQRLPATAYFTPSGWKEVWRRFLGSFKSMYTLAKCKKHIPGFSRQGFKAEALELYRDVCRLLAEGEKSGLRHLVTPAVFSDMKRQLKQREDGGWAHVAWGFVREPQVEELTTVHARLILMDPKDETSGFAQLTVRVPSLQRFAVYDRSGRLVAGSLDEAVLVEDFWVFEHSMRKSPANRWRLAGRLSIQPSGEEQQQQQRQQQQQQQQPQHKEEQAPASGPKVTAPPTGAAAEMPRVGHVSEQQRVQAQQQWSSKPKGRKAAARGRR